MPILRMQTEQTHDSGRLLMREAMLVLDQAEAVHQSWGGCSAEWESPGKADFAAEIEAIIARLQTLADQLDDLGLRTMREATQWETTDIEGMRRLAGG